MDMYSSIITQGEKHNHKVFNNTYMFRSTYYVGESGVLSLIISPEKTIYNIDNSNQGSMKTKDFIDLVQSISEVEIDRDRLASAAVECKTKTGVFNKVVAWIVMLEENNYKKILTGSSNYLTLEDNNNIITSVFTPKSVYDKLRER